MLVPVSAVTRDGDGLPIIWAGRMTRTFTPRWWARISASAVVALTVIVASRMKLPVGLLSISWITWSTMRNWSSGVPVGSLKTAPATGSNPVGSVAGEADLALAPAGAPVSAATRRTSASTAASFTERVMITT